MPVFDKYGNEIFTDVAIHPGEILLDELMEINGGEPLVQEIADKIGIDYGLLFGIVMEIDPITEEIAVKLEQFLKIPASFWISAQMEYDKRTLKTRKYESENR